VSDKPKRRWYQFSLASLIVVMGLASIAMAWVAYERNEVRKRKVCLAAIQKCGGFLEFRQSQPLRPAWLMALIGEEWFSEYEVETVIFMDQEGTVTDADLAHLADLTNLEGLYLNNTKITDAGLVHVGRLTNLKFLGLHTTFVADAGLAHLAGLTKLEELDLSYTQITDAGLVHLRDLTDLRVLEFDGARVTGAGFVHLSRLARLERLTIDPSYGLDERIREFTTRLPNLDISTPIPHSSAPSRVLPSGEP
jgi:Leucine-rich repeat (LRR) protein